MENDYKPTILERGAENTEFAQPMSRRKYYMSAALYLGVTHAVGYITVWAHELTHAAAGIGRGNEVSDIFVNPLVLGGGVSFVEPILEPLNGAIIMGAPLVWHVPLSFLALKAGIQRFRMARRAEVFGENEAARGISVRDVSTLRYLEAVGLLYQFYIGIPFAIKQLSGGESDLSGVARAFDHMNIPISEVGLAAGLYGVGFGVVLLQTAITRVVKPRTRLTNLFHGLREIWHSRLMGSGAIDPEQAWVL